MRHPFVDFTCRWFAITVGYDTKYDESGIWLYGPRRAERNWKTGQLRRCWNFRFCYYDIEGKRVWRHRPNEFPFRGNRRLF